MKHTEVLQLTLDLESELRQINPSWEEVFPILRTYLFFCFRPISNKNLKSTANRLTNIIDLLLHLPKSIYSLLQFRFSLSDNHNIIVAPALHRKLSTKGELQSEHMEAIAGTLVGEKTFFLERGLRQGMSKKDSTIANFSLILRVLNKILPIHRKAKNYEVLISFVEKKLQVKCTKNDLKLQIPISTLTRWIERYYFNTSLLDKLMPKTISIKKAFFVVYYDVDSFALITSLNKKGVCTIDYQHGIQNTHHSMYADFELYSSKPYCLPREYWVWDKIAKNRIQKWSSILNINVVESGRLLQPSQKKGRVKLNHNRFNQILVALQIWPDHFCPSLFEVIQNRQDINWIFREHPYWKVPNSVKNEIEAKYKNVKFIDIDNSSSADNFTNSFVCITGYSTMGIEALRYGTKTIFTHENAKEGLIDYIDGTDVIFANTKESIVQAIENFTRNLS